jgi:hypothetical protein
MTSIRVASGVAALVVSVVAIMGCGIGQTSDHDDGHHGPSYAIDTAPTTPQVVEHVRIHGHMGRPGVGARDPALG